MLGEVEMEVSEFKDVEMTLCKCGYIDEEIEREQ